MIALKELVSLIVLILPIVVYTADPTDPIITQWVKSTGNTGYGSQSTNINKIQYSTSYVYVSASGIPSYSIGPWSNPNTPSDQKFTFKFPRTAAAASGTKTATSLGHTGIWLNGVSIYNADDGQTIGAWKRNAYYFEASSFDSCLGHADASKEYHNHVIPICLYPTYNVTTTHSPLLGFAFDGYPIYGPYGYTTALDTTSAIKRLTPSYQLRSITQRRVLSNGTTLASSTSWGPDVNTTYPLGAFLDDYEFVSGSGDLDAYNGRFAKTPEYPSGTYIYIATIDASFKPLYPFNIGPSYYGVVVSNFDGKATPSETVTTYYSYSFAMSIQPQMLPYMLSILLIAIKNF